MPTKNFNTNFIRKEMFVGPMTETVVHKFGGSIIAGKNAIAKIKK